MLFGERVPAFQSQDNVALVPSNSVARQDLPSDDLADRVHVQVPDFHVFHDRLVRFILDSIRTGQRFKAGPAQTEPSPPTGIGNAPAPAGGATWEERPRHGALNPLKIRTHKKERSDPAPPVRVLA